MRLNEIQTPGQAILTESCRGLTASQRRIVEGIYRDLQPLIEVSLSTQQINQIFTGAEQGATAAGTNRTLVGRGVDVARTVDQTINKVGQWLQNTAPVQAFDQKFETLKGSIAQKFPEMSRSVSQLGEWAKANPGKTAAIIGVLTTIAALGGGPAGGAIAGQILRGTAELLKGEKLSTAVGKGAKTAAYGALAGYTINQIGDLLGNGARVVADNMFPGAQRLRMDFSVTGTGPSTFQNVTAVGRPEDIQGIRDAFNGAARAWDNGNYSQAQTMFDQARGMAAKLADPEYVASLTQNQELRQTVLGQAKNLVAATDAVAAGAQGAIQAQGSGQKQATAESRHLTTRQIAETFVRAQRGMHLLEYAPRRTPAAARTTATAQAATPAAQAPAPAKPGILSRAAGAVGQKLSTMGKNLTTKVTADKLTKAWQAAGSPTDSDAVFALLKKQGVDGGVIGNIWQQMKLPAPNPAVKPGQSQTGVGKTAPPTSVSPRAAGSTTSAAAAANRPTFTAKPGSAAPSAAASAAPTSAATSSPAATVSSPMKSDEIVTQLKSIWDQITSNQENPIGAPAVREFIKNMWMQTGGTKAMESRRAVQETTTAGSIATVAQPMGTVLRREPRGDRKKTGRKTS